MKILLVNDDGIDAEGIQIMARKLMGKHKVMLCAPERNWSFSSHYLSVHNDIKARRMEIEGLDGVECWAVSGSPADCASIGLRELVSEQPDIVLSGINRGENLGVADILSSGTYNAAACARRMGYPSAAISLARVTAEFARDYSYAAELSLQVADMLSSDVIDDDIVLNINVPGLEGRPHGVKICPLGTTAYIDEYEIHDTDGEKSYRQRWNNDASIKVVEGTDVYWNKQGYVTISPVKMPCIDDKAAKQLDKFGFSI